MIGDRKHSQNRTNSSKTRINADRNIAAGNPYKDLLADLLNRGVQIELCGATAKAHGWGNADLLPFVKVNTDAMSRTTQLVEGGFVKISK
jgi:intracellular sulfur oxidation DsrE/DsrF family protein